MALPVFSKTEHHIGLGDSTATKKGFMVSAYQEAVQSLPRAQDYGSGSPLVQAPSLSRWNMDNFLGGAYWKDFLQEDPTVSASTTNMIPTLQGKTLRTIPPMFQRTWINNSGGDSMTFVGGIQPFGEYHFHWIDTSWQIYNTAAFKARLEYYRPSSNTYGTAYTATLNTSGGYGKPKLEHGQLDNPILWCPAVVAASGGHAFIRLELTNQGAVVTAKTTYAAPTAASLPCKGMEPGAPVPIFCFGNKVYTAALSATDTTAPTWTLMDRILGEWVDSAVFNSITYILATNQDWKTVIYTTDGSALTMLLEFPYNFDGRVLLSYGGRLFCAGVGQDETGSDSYVELYEITGTSLRLVKSFSGDRSLNPTTNYSYNFGFDFTEDFPSSISALTVYEGFLWLGTTAGKIIAYDLTTDSLYGACEVIPANYDDTYPHINSEPSISGDAVTANTERAIRCSWTPQAFGGAQNVQHDFASVTDTATGVGTAYALTYQIMINPERHTANNVAWYMDVINSAGGGQTLRGQGVVDQNGIAVTGDVDSHALGKWYQRNLAFPGSWAAGANTVNTYNLICDSDIDLVEEIAYIRNAYIYNTATGAVVKRIWYYPSSVTLTDGIGLNGLVETAEVPVGSPPAYFSITKKQGFTQFYSHRKSLWAFMETEGAGAATAGQGHYRIAAPGDSEPNDSVGTYNASTDTFYGELETAEFQPEPALMKRYSQVALLTRYGTASVNAPTVDYSVDGGANWTSATVTQSISGDLRRTFADLSGATPSRSIKLRFRFPRESDADLSKFTEVVAFTMTFSFVDTGKRSWVFTILGNERIEKVDGTTLIQDIDLMSTTFDSWITNTTPLFFTDLDGEAYKVQMVSLAKNFPVVAPRIDGDYREAAFSVSLVEV